MVCAPYKFCSDAPLGGVLYARGSYSEGGFYMPVDTVTLTGGTCNLRQLPASPNRTASLRFTLFRSFDVGHPTHAFENQSADRPEQI
jgi:hypothetical protein